VLFAALRAGGQRLAVPKGQWPRLAMLAFFNITCWNLLVAFGITMIPSGRAAILAYMMPAWAIPLSIWIVGERLTGAKLVGFVLGMAGLALLLGEALATVGSAPLGSLLILGASFSWALGTVLQKRFPVSMAAGPYTAWIMLLGGVPIFVGALLLDDFRWLGEITLWPALGIAYNVLIAFAWAHWAWIKIATSVPVTVFSLSMLVIPVIGVISGMLFLGERPSWVEYAALGFVLASLLTVTVPPRRTLP
jgi:drug/metabolite transporter (DMT)-like permease